MIFSALDQLPPLRDVIAKYDLMARKSLGQHFLCDLNLTRKIAGFAGDLSGLTVFEVGPGPGGLTRALLATNAKEIIAIEKDPRCVAALQDLRIASKGRLTLIEGDALKINMKALVKSEASGGRAAVIANLPYNIGTELLIGWLHNMLFYKSLTLMFQSEVVDRLVAKPNSKDYGRLSVLTQFCTHAERVMDIPARAFTPPPKVDSAVVHITQRPDLPRDVELKTLEKITAAAFGQRRKMLRSSLKSLGGEPLLVRAAIDPELRAENLTLVDFENLVRAIRG